MTRFSEDARRFAAAARDVIKARQSSPVREQPKSKPPRSIKGNHRPPGAPLDRRRHVPFTEMSDSDLDRALNQAKARVERTKQSADLDRYKTQVLEVGAELARRAQSQPTEPRPTPPRPEPQRTARDPDAGDPNLKRNKSTLQTEFPGDTPESPLI